MICPGLPGELPMNYANIKYFDIADGEGVQLAVDGKYGFISLCIIVQIQDIGYLVQIIEVVPFW